MKIDASRFSMFWANPERYRLREIWKLTPKEPSMDSFAGLLSFGRRRGTCFHELMDADYRGILEPQAVQDLIDGDFEEKAIATGLRMKAAVKTRYFNETYLAHESLFEYQIPGSPHIMTGRIDHILSDEDGPVIGDWKGSNSPTKKEMQKKIETYKNSAQVDFYLIGATTLGFNTGRFLYRVLENVPRRPPKIAHVKIHEAWTERTGLQLDRFSQYVHVTCEMIEFLKRTFGVENPWPVLHEPFDRGYGAILGRKRVEGLELPEGFTEKIEHLESMMEDPEESDA